MQGGGVVMHRCVMVEWRYDWSDSTHEVYARMAWIDVNAIAARWPAFAQGAEGRDDRDEMGGEA